MRLLYEVEKMIQRFLRERRRRKEVEMRCGVLLVIIAVLLEKLAELTWQAQDLERRLLDTQRELELWKDGWRLPGGED